MADVVFEVYDARGGLQLSKDGFIARYVTQGIVDSGGPLTFSSGASFRINVPQNVSLPIIAVRSPMAVGPYFVGGLENGSYPHYYTASSPGKLAYYIFDAGDYNGPLPGGAGLELRDESGRVVFSTVVGFPPIYATLGSAGQSVQLPQGRLYAAVVNGFSGSRTQTVRGEETSNPRIDQVGVQTGSIIVPQNSGGYIASATNFDIISSTNMPMSSRAPDFYIPLDSMMIIDVTQYGALPGEITYSISMSPSSLYSEGVDSTSSGEIGHFYPTAGGVYNISAYNWSINPTSGGGNWGLNGQGTGDGRPYIINAPANSTNVADIFCDVTINGDVRRVKGTATYRNRPNPNAPGVTVNSISKSGKLQNTTFQPTATTVNGSASSYSWSIGSTTGGSWSLSSGQGTASPIFSVTGVQSSDTASAAVTCVAVINGQSYSGSASLLYSNTTTN